MAMQVLDERHSGILKAVSNASMLLVVLNLLSSFLSHDIDHITCYISSALPVLR